MEETPVFGFPYPGKKDPPAGAAQIEGLAKAVETRLALLEKLTGTKAAPVVPAAGQLLVVDGTGHAAYKAMSGDATINSAGVFSLGNEKVTPAKIANLAVETAKLANLAVSTAKLENLAVTTAKLAELAVTAEKIAAEAVTTGKIAALAVTTAKIALNAITTALIADGAVTRAKLASDAKPLHWYPPKIILNEESRTGFAFGLMPNPDVVENVVLPNNGLIVVLYDATWRGNGSEGSANAAIFLNETQLRVPDGGAGEPVPQEATKAPNGFNSGYFARLNSYWNGLLSNDSVGDATGNEDYGSGVAMGHLQGNRISGGGACYIYADAGTYDISIRFRASAEDKLRVNRRKLFVGVIANGS